MTRHSPASGHAGAAVRATAVEPSHAAVRPRLTLAAVALVQFLVSVDLAIVNVALPPIGASLGFGPAGLTWVVNAYVLTFGGLLLLGGTAADRYGRRRVLLAGLTVFGLASLAGGLAQVPAQLVAARAVQGIGAAALAPAALSLLSATFPSGRARIRAFGVWSATNASGGAFGVLAGGVLTEFLGWRAVMFVSVPIVLTALALALRALTREGPIRRPIGRPDVLGALLGTAGLTTLALAVVRTDRYPLTSAVTLTTAGIAVILLVAFIRVEWTARAPLLRPGLLANRWVAGANAYNLVLGAVMAAALYFLPLHMQRVLGAGPAVTGLMLLPFALGVIAGSVLAVRAGHRLPPRTLLAAGGLLTAIGFGWYGLIGPEGTYLTDVLGPEILASVGYGLCLGPVVSLATAGVATHEVGTASGLLATSRQVGAGLGLAVLGAVATHRTGPVATVPTLTDGYGLGLGLCAALLVVAVLLALTVLPRNRPEGSGS